MVSPSSTTTCSNNSFRWLTAMDSSIHVANHTMYIVWAILWNVGKITTFGNHSNYCLSSLSNPKMLIVIRNIFNSFKGIAHSYPWNKSFFRTMCWGRMLKIKSCINANSHNQKPFSKFRHTIICEIIKMRCYYITRSNALKILDYLLNSLFLISSKQSFYILCDKCLWLFGINKSKETFI